MDRRNMIWPLTGTGENLASLLRVAATNGVNGLSGNADQIVGHYLVWVSDQLRMLQGALAPHDIDRFLTTPRYWATLEGQISPPAVVLAVQQEVQHLARLLNTAAHAVATEVDAWRPRDGQFTNLLVPDTNFWVNVQDSLNTLDWHGLVADIPGPSQPAMQDEVRIVVPMIVIDELDGLSHRRETRPKVTSVTKFLYSLLGESPGLPQQIRSQTSDRGEVTIQLLMDPLSHVRLPNSDDELVERIVTLRDFLGHSPKRVFFVTHDGGAAFRSTAAGLMTRHAPTPAR